MKNTIKTYSLVTMILSVSVLVKSVDVYQFWMDYPIISFIVFMISVVVWTITGMEE